MKQFKLAASILLINASLLSSTAFAHVSFKGESMPVVASSHNWTGFYAGLNAGAVSHTMSITDNQATSFLATLQQISNPAFTGGLQIGYRRQLDLIKTSGVYGAELSSNYLNSTFNRNYGSPFSVYQFNAKNQLKNICLLQVTGGIAADRTLLFLAAGLSWSNIMGKTTNLDSIAFFHSFNVNNKALGAAVSGGVEYAFSDTISARVKLDVISPGTYSVTDDTGNTYEISNSIVQGTVGINYNIA
jgi:opacity protein-like surface antigen